EMDGPYPDIHIHAESQEDRFDGDRERAVGRGRQPYADEREYKSQRRHRRSNEAGQRLSRRHASRKAKSVPAPAHRTGPDLLGKWALNRGGAGQIVRTW